MAMAEGMERPVPGKYVHPNLIQRLFAGRLIDGLWRRVTSFDLYLKHVERNHTILVNSLNAKLNQLQETNRKLHEEKATIDQDRNAMFHRERLAVNELEEAKTTIAGLTGQYDAKSSILEEREAELAEATRRLKAFEIADAATRKHVSHLEVLLNIASETIQAKNREGAADGNE